ncbi:MAG: DegV family protein [Cellulosilyticaceae bacterium]
MEKIKFLTDTACDLPLAYAKERDVELIPIAILVDDEEYMQSQNGDYSAFYEMLKTVKDIPKTSQITAYTFLEYFKKAYEEGYTHVVGLFLPSFASGTYQNALLAKQDFYEECPEAKHFVIHIPDSGTYSVAYGYPIAQAACMYQEGAQFVEITAFIEDWISHIEVYFSMYTLEFARKSGRIGTVSAIVGDALGLKPIICVKNGEAKLYKKVRGKKAVIKELAAIAEARMASASPFAILKGQTDQYGQELLEAIQSKHQNELIGVFHSGPAVTINSGPDVIGIGFMGK